MQNKFETHKSRCRTRDKFDKFEGHMEKNHEAQKFRGVARKYLLNI